MILDCEDNTLAFEKNYEFLGKGQAECVNIDYTLNVILYSSYIYIMSYQHEI